MDRLSPLTEDELNDDQRAVLDAINAGPRTSQHGRIGLIGPFGVWVRSPAIGGAVQELGGNVRFSTTLGEDVKEVAICCVGAFHHAKFEFAAHARLATNAGVREEVVEAIRTADAPEFNADDRAAHLDVSYAVAQALLNEHRLSDDLFATAKGAFGESGVVELISVIGYYVLVSYTLNTFEVPLTPGMIDPFPEI